MAAHDDDTAHGDRLTYVLLPVADYRSFAINASTGVVRTQQLFDFNGKRRYNVTVRATDTTNRTVEYTVVFVIVIVNFVREHRHGCVWFSSPLLIVMILVLSHI